MEFWSYWTIIQRNTGLLVLSKKKMEIHNINISLNMNIMLTLSYLNLLGNMR